MFAQGFKPTSNTSASYPLLSTVHALSLQMAWIQCCPTTNGDFPLAGATGVWVSGANRVEVNSYALLRRFNWSQLGRCSQQEDLLQYRNPPLLTPAFPICRLIVAIETTQEPPCDPAPVQMPRVSVQVCAHTGCWGFTSQCGSVWDIPSSMGASLHTLSITWMCTALVPQAAHT